MYRNNGKTAFKDFHAAARFASKKIREDKEEKFIRVEAPQMFSYAYISQFFSLILILS